jgi:hypothetical protein
VTKQQTTRRIPHPNAPGYFAVTDGVHAIGTIVQRDGSWFAFDTSGELVGEYGSKLEAVRALPNRSRS